jgi:hypothetical protein
MALVLALHTVAYMRVSFISSVLLFLSDLVFFPCFFKYHILNVLFHTTDIKLWIVEEELVGKNVAVWFTPVVFCCVTNTV